MKEKNQINVPLFDEGPKFNDETLLVNKARLLDVLADAKSSSDIHTLRHNVAVVKNKLQDVKSSLRTSVLEEELVEFSAKVLFEDLDQIAAAQTKERASYYVDRLIKSLTQEKINSINDINLNRWKEYDDIMLDSLWVIDKRESAGVHSAGYWGNFIPQIPNQMMRRYTKKGDWVLDTFAGSGTTFIEGKRLGRNVIGNELQPEVAKKARDLVSLEPNRYSITTEIVVGDSVSIDYQKLLAQYGQRSAQFIIMHPPYFDIIKFSEEPRDLSNASTLETFLEMIGKVVENASKVLDRGRYLALVIGDKYEKGEWLPLGFLTMNEVLSRGFTLKSIIVKNFEETTGKRQQKELWQYRALVGGFYIFKHEYIFLFKKA